jgi:uncharacterized protein (DUF58 family)
MFRQVSLLLKTWGIYFVVLIYSIVFNRVYPGYISSVLFYSLLMLPIISLVHLGFTYTVFRLTHDVDQRFVSKGDTVTYRLSLHNATPFILAPMTIHYLSSKELFHLEEDNKNAWLVLYPKSQRDLHKNLTCFYRGNYSVGVDYIKMQDFFGFFGIHYKDIEQHKILVYPNLHEFKSDVMRQVMSETAETIVGHDFGSSTVFTDVRKYQPGDSLNKIHWKLSAKKNTWISKEYMGHVTNTTYLFLDTYDLDLSIDHRIIYEDYMVEGCISLVHYLLSDRVELKLYYDYHGIQNINGKERSAFNMFYDAFAHMTFYHENNYTKMINKVLLLEKESSHLIFATQQIQPEFVDLLVQLKSRNFEITVVLVHASSIQLNDLKKATDEGLMLVLNTSNIPIYYLRMDDGAVRLEVS